MLSHHWPNNSYSPTPPKWEDYSDKPQSFYYQVSSPSAIWPAKEAEAFFSDRYDEFEAFDAKEVAYILRAFYNSPRAFIDAGDTLWTSLDIGACGGEELMQVLTARDKYNQRLADRTIFTAKELFQLLAKLRRIPEPKAPKPSYSLEEIKELVNIDLSSIRPSGPLTATEVRARQREVEHRIDAWWKDASESVANAAASRGWEKVYGTPRVAEWEARKFTSDYEAEGGKSVDAALPTPTEPVREADYSVANAISNIPPHSPLQYIQET